MHSFVKQSKETSLSNIITARLSLIISALVVTKVGTYYQVQSCAELLFLYEGDEQTALSKYPICLNETTRASQMVAVKAQLGGDGGSEGAGAALRMGFGTALWIAIFLHGVGVEIYLNLTTAESERLRNVSYERQLEAGFEHPGSAGLTSDRWGDAPEWKPTATNVDS